MPPNDIAGAFQWAVDHAGVVIWAIAIIGGTIFGNRAKRRRQQIAARVTARGQAAAAAAAPPVMRVAPPVSAAPVTVAAPSYDVPYAVPTPATPPVRRPVAAAPNPPPSAGVRRSGLLGAFGDPAHARTAVILSELLAPPVALR